MAAEVCRGEADAVRAPCVTPPACAAAEAEAAAWGRQPPLLDGAEAARLLASCREHWAADGPWEAEDLEAAARAAAARLCRRLGAALRDEGLLPGAELRLEGRALALTWPRGAEGAGAASLEDLGALARLCCASCPGAEANEAAVERELRNAFEHECLCLAFWRRVWRPRFATAASLWDLVQQQSDWSLEERLLFLEQFAAFAGHPLHVMAKSRLPLSPGEAAAFAPEFRPEVRLGVLAVHRELVRVWPSAEAWQALWAEQCPAAAEALRAALGEAGPAAADFVLLPLHPLNLPQVRRLYGGELEAGRMRLLEAVGVPAAPTLSLRTLSPRGAFPGLRLKLPVPVFATSLPRYVSPVEVRGSVLISRALRALELPEELAVQPEEFAAHLAFGEGAAHSYEDARYCSAILRTSAAALADPARTHAPLAAMFCSPQGDGGPVLWEDFWRCHGVADGRAWFRRYLATALRAHLGVFLRFGLAMEAHQQNTVLEFGEGGELRRLICQELGGGIFWDPERLALLPCDFRYEVYARDDVLVPYDKCLACMRQTLLRAHLLPLAACVAAAFRLEERELLADLGEALAVLPASVPQARGDGLPTAAYADYAARSVEALARPGPLKALLRMRLLQTKSEVYV